jgi:hypothetical protein
MFLTANMTTLKQYGVRNSLLHAQYVTFITKDCDYGEGEKMGICTVILN